MEKKRVIKNNIVSASFSPGYRDLFFGWTYREGFLDKRIGERHIDF